MVNGRWNWFFLLLEHPIRSQQNRETTSRLDFRLEIIVLPFCSTARIMSGITARWNLWYSVMYKFIFKFEFCARQAPKSGRWIPMQTNFRLKKSSKRGHRKSSRRFVASTTTDHKNYQHSKPKKETNQNLSFLNLENRLLLSKQVEDNQDEDPSRWIGSDCYAITKGCFLPECRHPSAFWKDSLSRK